MKCGSEQPNVASAKTIIPMTKPSQRQKAMQIRKICKNENKKKEKPNSTQIILKIITNIVRLFICLFGSTEIFANSR